MSRMGPMLVVVCPDGHASGLTLTGEEQKRLLLELARARGVRGPGGAPGAGRKPAPRATAEQRGLAAELWAQGLTMAQVCERTGLTESQMKYLIRDRERFPRRYKKREG